MRVRATSVHRNTFCSLPTLSLFFRYLPAIYDPSTRQVMVQPAVPTYVLAQRTKRTKLSNLHVNSRESDVSNMAKRDMLGEAFGTRKAKSRIRANERNKVDANAQESVRDHLMVTIEEAARTGATSGRSLCLEQRHPLTDAAIFLPRADAEADTPLVSRLIPAPNITTSDPSEVYPISLLIPPEEAAAIDIKGLANAKADDKERLAILPFRGSRWLEQRLRLALDLPSPVKTRHL